MAKRYADNVKEMTATFGTGTVVLEGAVSGSRSFAQAVLDGDLVAGEVVTYGIRGAGMQWEIGYGTYTPGQLTRDTVLSSGAGGARVTFASAAEVYITQAAADVVDPSETGGSGGSGGGGAIADGSVTNAKLAAAPAGTTKGVPAGGSAVTDLTTAQQSALTIAALAVASADIAANSRKITGLANPTNAQDAATKAYVDSVGGGGGGGGGGGSSIANAGRSLAIDASGDLVSAGLLNATMGAGNAMVIYGGSSTAIGSGGGSTTVQGSTVSVQPRSNSSVVLSSGETDTTDATPTTIGDTFAIVDLESLSVDARVECVRPGAVGKTTFFVRRAFLRSGVTVLATAQSDTLLPEELGTAIVGANVAITRTGNTGRVTVVGAVATPLRWRADVSLSRLAVAAASGFNPASLAWTGWVNGDGYNAGTGVFTGRASAGSSGARNFTTSGSPALGSPMAGHATVAFDGLDDSLRYTSGAEGADLLGTGNWTIVTLARITSAPSSAALAYSNATLGCDSGAYRSFSVASTGPTLQVYQYAPGTPGTEPQANKVGGWAFGAWAVFQARYDGTNLSVRVGKGAWTNTPSTVGSGVIGSWKAFANRLDTLFMPGGMAEYLTASVGHTTADLDSVCNYMAAEYGVTV